MPIKTRYYWDSCAWLGLINNEAKKHRELSIIWSSAKRGRCEIVTSALSQVEVFKKKCEDDDPRPLSEENDRLISDLFMQDHVVRVQLTPVLAESARSLLRQHKELKKAPDAIHLATALFANCVVMHTYDASNLLPLDGLLNCKNGSALSICLPDTTTDGPLFAHLKDITEKDVGDP